MQAVNRLNTRSSVEHFQSADPVRLEGSEADLDRPRLLLLIHGFANTEESAHKSYEAFQSALTTWASPGSGGWDSVWEFHWPGNRPGSKALDVATYPMRVPVADLAGAHLANFLANLGRTRYLKTRQQLFIVAHSLGCRVALNAIRLISQNPEYAGPTVTKVFLLAAAVPVSFCLPEGAYHPLTGDSREKVFFSRRDKALRPLVFDTAQRSFGEPGDAVGRSGRPDPPRWTSSRETPLDHDEYWGSRDYVAQFIAQDLLAGPVTLPEVYLPADELDSLEVTGLPPTEGRELGTRQ
jgi:pimeloyl-ACP methyl ester carboxylesterase